MGSYPRPALDYKVRESGWKERKKKKKGKEEEREKEMKGKEEKREKEMKGKERMVWHLKECIRLNLKKPFFTHGT